MKEYGMMFRDWCVRAILAGEKTATRRKSFKGKVGDRIWVRESWREVAMTKDRYEKLSMSMADGRYERLPVYIGSDLKTCVSYRASNGCDGPWKPSMFMPKNYTRIWLEVIGIYKQPLRQMNHEQAIQEGSLFWMREYKKDHGEFLHGDLTPVAAFMTLWEQINGPKAILLNQEVTCIDFRVIDLTKDAAPTLPQDSKLGG